MMSTIIVNKGKIVKIISNDYTVKYDDNIVICKIRGIFRKEKKSPLVGDIVEFDLNERIITNILKRKNELIRPRIANIDEAFIIVSVKNPDLDLNLLDKLLTIITFNNIKPVICFTKLDLLDDLEEINVIKDYYNKIGYDVFYNTETEKLKKAFKDKIIVFAGQSGAGKSSLLNKLDESLNIKTNDISYALNRGKHTTTHVELIPLFGGMIADTPGFSSLDFYDMTNSDIKDGFIDFNIYRDKCKYKDCMHDKEDDCYIKKLVKDGIILASRYNNYIKFISREMRK